MVGLPGKKTAGGDHNRSRHSHPDGIAAGTGRSAKIDQARGQTAHITRSSLDDDRHIKARIKQ
jgi:hypothetical protein